MTDDNGSEVPPPSGIPLQDAIDAIVEQEHENAERLEEDRLDSIKEMLERGETE